MYVHILHITLCTKSIQLKVMYTGIMEQANIARLYTNFLYLMYSLTDNLQKMMTH